MEKQHRPRLTGTELYALRNALVRDHYRTLDIIAACTTAYYVRTWTEVDRECVDLYGKLCAVAFRGVVAEDVVGGMHAETRIAASRRIKQLER